MEDLLAELQNPALVHVVLAHVPVVGLACGALGLLIALFFRDRVSQLPSLAVIVISAAAVLPVQLSGQESYRLIRSNVDNAGADWLDEHMDRSGRAIGVFSGLAAITLIAIVIPIRWPRTALPLGTITLAATLAALAVATHIALAGYGVRHPQFRPAPPPSTLPMPPD